MSEFESKLLAHFNRPVPTNPHHLTDLDWKLNDAMVERSQEIVRMFSAWDETTGPCPISIVDKHWFTKLCGLAEWIALLEAKIDPTAFPDVEDED